MVAQTNQWIRERENLTFMKSMQIIGKNWSIRVHPTTTTGKWQSSLQSSHGFFKLLAMFNSLIYSIGNCIHKWIIINLCMTSIIIHVHYIITLQNQAQISRMHKLKATTECFIDLSSCNRGFCSHPRDHLLS